MARVRRPWSPRWELWMVRSDDASVPVALRSRHHVHFMAELSRRLDEEHEGLVRQCRLVVLRARDRPSGPRTSAAAKDEPRPLLPG